MAEKNSEHYLKLLPSKLNTNGKKINISKKWK